MKNYAMIRGTRILDIVYESLQEPKWPADPTGTRILAVECSREVTREWAYDPDTGTFISPDILDDTTILEDDKSQMDRIEEKLDRLAEGSVDQEYLDYYTAVNAALQGGV